MLRLQNIATVGTELALAWEDGKENYLSFEGLRRACPCAACCGEADALGRVIRPNVHYKDNSFDLVRYEMIGGYAVQLFWADGHSTGLYPFQILRDLKT